jgi:hypothetical protein
VRRYACGTGAVNGTPILAGRPLVDDLDDCDGVVDHRQVDTTYDIAPERVAVPSEPNVSVWDDPFGCRWHAGSTVLEVERAHDGTWTWFGEWNGAKAGPSMGHATEVAARAEADAWLRAQPGVRTYDATPGGAHVTHTEGEGEAVKSDRAPSPSTDRAAIEAEARRAVGPLLRSAPGAR